MKSQPQFVPAQTRVRVSGECAKQIEGTQGGS